MQAFNGPTMVAIDLGAQSSRVSLLRSIGNKPQLQVVHRSANRPLATPRGLMWDFDTMFGEIVEGLKQCAALAPEGIASIGADGWACDYIRIGDDGEALDQPFCYRDERSLKAMEALHKFIAPKRLYELTGGQVVRYNTLYQLYADRLNGIPSPRLWLNLPEYVLYRLGGRPVSEYTNATHTQMLDIESRNWCPEIFDAVHLALSAAPEAVPTGTDIGRVSGELAGLKALRNTRLIAPACHDTPSAIAGIPATGDDWAFISSGTWSLVGTPTDRCYTGDYPFSKTYTNQGAIGGGFYFIKNVNGMWILHQCMEHWESHGQGQNHGQIQWTVQDLTEASASLPAPGHLLDVDDPDLVAPGDMPARINAQMVRRGYPPIEDQPANAPRFANLIFHSLAARYAEVIADLSSMTGKKFKRVFVVGGGVRNQAMNHLIEKATGLEVVRGSAESSTIGNFAIQMAAMEQGPSSTGVQAASVARWASAFAHMDEMDVPSAINEQ